MKKIKGFTFIELLISLSIMSILVFMVGGYYGSSLKRGRDQDRKNDIRQYQLALENYANNNDSVYPISTSTILATGPLCTTLGTLLQSCPQDPKVPEVGFDYNYQSSASGSIYVLWAKLEANPRYWVVCSNRKSGEKPVTGFSISGGNCPL